MKVLFPIITVPPISVLPELASTVNLFVFILTSPKIFTSELRLVVLDTSRVLYTFVFPYTFKLLLKSAV